MTKRIFDFTCSLLLLVGLLPIFLIVSFLIKKEDRGLVFYRGDRVGKNGRLFKMYKFRTMVENADKIGGPSTSDCDARITKAGLFLRKHKLDEIPQLINVLKGEMSLVGPRPEVKKYTDMYTDTEKCILSVRPGITDWASLANPDEGAVLAQYPDPDRAYEEIIRPKKLQLQLKYVSERTFLGDIKIIFQTFAKVVTK